MAYSFGEERVPQIYLVIRTKEVNNHNDHDDCNEIRWNHESQEAFERDRKKLSD